MSPPSSSWCFCFRGVDIKREMTRYRAGLASAPVAGFMLTYNKHTLSLEDLGTLEEQNWLNDQVQKGEGWCSYRKALMPSWNLLLYPSDVEVTIRVTCFLVMLHSLTLKLPSLPVRLLTCMENSSWRQHNTRWIWVIFKFFFYVAQNNLE